MMFSVYPCNALIYLHAKECHHPSCASANSGSRGCRAKAQVSAHVCSWPWCFSWGDFFWRAEERRWIMVKCGSHFLGGSLWCYVVMCPPMYQLDSSCPSVYHTTVCPEWVLLHHFAGSSRRLDQSLYQGTWYLGRLATWRCHGDRARREFDCDLWPLMIAKWEWKALEKYIYICIGTWKIEHKIHNSTVLPDVRLSRCGLKQRSFLKIECEAETMCLNVCPQLWSSLQNLGG